MTTPYAAIVDTETDPDAPITSFLAKRWSKNVEAMFEGQPGAPRLNIRALGRVNAGGVPKILIPGTFTTPSTATGSRLNKDFGINQFGSVRVQFTVNSGNPAGWSIERYRNSSGVVIVSGSGNGLKVADIPVQPGDLIQCAIWSNGGLVSSASNYYLLTNGEDVIPTFNNYGDYLNAYAIP